jgi:hypothetical protein
VLAQSPIPANSDYFPFLDLNAGRARYREQMAMMFHTWGVAPLPILEMLGLEPFDYGAVVETPAFGRTALINRAQAVHAAIGEGQNRSASPLGAAATVVGLLSGTCDATKQEDIWLSGLHTVAEASLPFLGAADATSLVASALPSECAPSLSPRLKVWTDLYGAVAARNAQGMADAGEAALQQGGVEDGRLYYALSAAMLGHLATHRPDRTLQLWRERPDRLQRVAATPDIELVIRVAEKRLADGVLLSQRPAR